MKKMGVNKNPGTNKFTYEAYREATKSKKESEIYARNNKTIVK